MIRLNLAVASEQIGNPRGLCRGDIVMYSNPHNWEFTKIYTTMKYIRSHTSHIRQTAAAILAVAMIGAGLFAWRTASAAQPGIFGKIASTLTAAMVYTEPIVGPGMPIVGSNGPKSAASSNKAGSLLLFPKYTSSSTNPSGVNTLISLTNANPSDGASVRIFFIHDCQVESIFLNLAGNQTRTLLASDVNPGNTGYVIVTAVNANGWPTQFNWLIGSASIKDANGHESSYNAVSVSKRTGGPVPVLEGETAAQIRFDDTDYDRLPQLIALDNIQAQDPSIGAGAERTDVAVISPQASLTSTASQNLQFTAIAFDNTGRPYPKVVNGACGLSDSVGQIWSDPALDTFVAPGSPAWGRFSASIDSAPVPVLGISLTDGTSSPLNNVRQMQVLSRLDSFTMSMPIVAPDSAANEVITTNLPDADGGALGASEMKSGSVLIYPRFTSGVYGSSRINITNTHPTQKARVRVFYTGLVDSPGVVESVISVLPNQSLSLDPNDVSPNQKGWVIATAIDNTAKPLNFNFLIGSAQVQDQNGQPAGYNAIAIAKNSAGSVPNNPENQTADLIFNDVEYDRLPSTLAINGLASQVDNTTLLGYFRPPASLLEAPNTRGSVQVTAYDELLGQATATIGGIEVRVGQIRTSILSPPITSSILKGSRGWLKMTPGSPIFPWVNNKAEAAFSAQIGSGIWMGGINGGQSFHVLAVTDSFQLSTTANNPNNNAPVANFESIPVYNEARGVNGTIVRLDGRISTDPDSEDVLTYKWYDGETLISTAPVSDYRLGIGLHYITLLVTDTSGQVSEPKTAIVEVIDTTPPQLSGIPSNITKTTGSFAGVALNFPLPFAYDMVDGFVSVTASKLPGSVFPIGKTTVTFTARDTTGNESKASMTVTVIKGIATLPTIGGVAGNKAPYMNNLNDQYVVIGKPRQIILQASDPENDSVILTLVNAPSYAQIVSIDPVARKATLNINPQEGDQVVASNVRIIATDTKGGVFSTLPFRIQISDVENDENGTGNGPGGGGGDPGGGGGDPGGGGGGDPNNKPPVAKAAALPATVQATSKFGATIQLDVSMSSDPDGDPLTYVWKDGDQIIAEGALASAVIPVGQHSITLTVSDGKGGVNTSEPQIVEVLPRPLTITSVTPAKIPRFNIVTMTITGTGFTQGTQIRFDCTSFCSGGSQITVTINQIEEDRIVLSAKTTQNTPLGNRDAVATHPNGTSFKLLRSNYVAQ